MLVKVARIACLELGQGKQLIKENSQGITEPSKYVSISTHAKQEGHARGTKTKISFVGLTDK